MIAQLVEQWTENPCVAGSTPARTTKAVKLRSDSVYRFFIFSSALVSDDLEVVEKPLETSNALYEHKKAMLTIIQRENKK